MLIAEQFLTFLLGCAICYRVTRLAILDTIFDAPRDWVHAWLLNGNDEGRPLVRFVAATVASACVVLAMVYAAGAAIGTWPWMHDIDRSEALIWCGVFTGGALLCVVVAILFGFDGPTWLGHKIEEMISCPYCLSIWVAFGFQIMVWPVRSIPLPALYYLAVSAGGMVWYQYIDFEPEEDNELD